MIGAEHYLDPVIDGQAATMLIASDHDIAKDIAMQLAAEIGFDPIDAGPLANSRMLEAIAEMWVFLMLRTDIGRDFAFRLIRE